ncbi:hypothetical protein K2173_017733 [Erythroxylum novogranatense]|uniref:Uncharacterized protein n=1 Tax=Erythroxylum novogranatense TaxID=1862640 RepID=A0AAV8T2U6_9ROSI|nr:hypothetical protein K2173_017733 [Erythroxylum novogranatense]
MSRREKRYRGNSTCSTPRSHGWSQSRHDSDDMFRSFISDAEVRQRPTVSFIPVDNVETCMTRTEVVVHTLESFADEDKLRSPLSSVRDRPNSVDEYLAKVDAESRKPKFGPLNPAKWSQANKYADHYGSASGRKDYNDWGDKERQKHKGHTSQNDSGSEPAMITTGGWARPSHATWATPPEGYLSPNKRN